MLKKRMLLTVIVCLCLTVLGCDDKGAWEGDYLVNNYSDLMGLAGYTSVTGSLIITDVTDNPVFPYYSLITNLKPLKNLTEIGGTLKIYQVPTLTSLDGLENLQTVGENLVLETLPLLTSVKGLSNIRTVGDKMTLNGLDALKNLDCFGNITSVPGSMTVMNLDVLKSLSTFSRVTSIGGNLTVYDNDQLSSLEFDSLSRVEGFFKIQDNPTLPLILIEELRDRILAGNGIGGQTIISFNYDDTVDGIVFFGDYSIHWASDFDDLDGIKYITGNLIIENGSYFTLLDGWVSNGGQDSLERLTALRRIGGALEISRNVNLQSFKGLNNLEWIGDRLWIVGNSSLTSLSDLAKLSYIGGKFWTYNNDALPEEEIDALRDQVLARDGIGRTY